MKEGFIVKSIKGHDEGRVYLVVSEVNENFVLLVDGKYRKLDNPKLKRKKHVAVVEEAVVASALTDAAVRKLCNK